MLVEQEAAAAADLLHRLSQSYECVQGNTHTHTHIHTFIPIPIHTRTRFSFMCATSHTDRKKLRKTTIGREKKVSALSVFVSHRGREQFMVTLTTICIRKQDEKTSSLLLSRLTKSK